jgi:hypothetical protein
MRITTAMENVLTISFPIKTITPNILAENSGNCQVVHKDIIKEKINDVIILNMASFCLVNI